MNRRTQRRVANILKYLLVLCLGAGIVAAVYFLLPDNTMAEETTTTEPPTVSSSTAEPTTEPRSSTDSWLTTEAGEPTVNAVDAVNVDLLIDRYYSAKINGDAGELNKIVEAETEYDDASLLEEVNIIEKYDNFHTYVIPGLTDNYFIVYVKYDIFFNGIVTGAPSLNHFIVARDADGVYYIYDKSVSGEFKTFLEETEKTQTVLKLREQVERELAEAREKNSDLDYFLALLSGEVEEPTVAPTTAAASTTASEQAEEGTTEATQLSEE